MPARRDKKTRARGVDPLRGSTPRGGRGFSLFKEVGEPPMLGIAVAIADAA
jgi:hypothetical protein